VPTNDATSNTTVSGNTCIYWVKEPGVCGNWDPSIPACSDETATYYPYCNFIGTLSDCSKYDGSGTKFMCVRPDPSRTLPNRKTGQAWVKVPTTAEGSTTEDVEDIENAGNFDAIQAYNDGECDGKGFGVYTTPSGQTRICDGYVPYGLDFGPIVPTKDEHIDEYEFTSVSGFSSRLPLNYEIYNKKALLSRCYWWKGAPNDFAPLVVSSGIVVTIPTVSGSFKCQYPNDSDEIKKHKKFKYDSEDLHAYLPPCNGAVSSCPYYTGVCWEYCIDEKLRSGDKVSAQQILELRYYLRRNKWTKDSYKKAFKEPELYAWKGKIDYIDDNQILSVNEVKYKIPAIKVSLDDSDDFKDFKVKTEDCVLTTGTPNVDDHKKHYPSLVKSIHNYPTAPIIRSIFTKIPGIEITTNSEGAGEETATSSGSQTVFETADFNHKHILLVGDVFYYSTNTYALNLMDKDIDIPSDIKSFLDDYDSMEDAKQNLVDTYDDLYFKLDCYLDYLIEYYPDHLIKSSMSGEEGMFYIKALSFWGDNTIVVLDKGSGRWEFDKINIKKIFCGGVIGQTSFSIIGEGGTTYLPAYERDFGAYINNNGEIKFSFFPLSRYGQLAGMYMDGVCKKLPSLLNPPSYNTYELTYRLVKKKVAENLVIEAKDMTVIGNAGYILIEIPDDDNELHDCIKPWKIEGYFRLKYPSNNETDAQRRSNTPTQDEYVDMEVVTQDSSLMPSNQCLIKPTDIKKFRSVCKDVTLEIEKVYQYDRVTVKSENDIDGEVVKESFISGDDKVQYRVLLDLEVSGNSATLKGFGYDSLTAAALIKGASGHIVGQVKSKLITWIRQPYCRDVEIYYSWDAYYKHYTLLPEYWCYGNTGVRHALDTVSQSFTPPCGDHNLSFFSEIGPMWYPYNDCDNYARYNVVTQLTEYDTQIMELFPKDPSGTPHGSFDMRMLGPADNFGVTSDSHASIWACHCDWSYENYQKITENIFNGYARYRGGISAYDLYMLTRFGGRAPKFGNVYRDYLKSYRSMDNVQYYYLLQDNYIVLRKWVPMYEGFTSSDLGKQVSDHPYLLYCSNDYVDDRHYFFDSMGLLLAEDIEGVDIGEKIIEADSEADEEVDDGNVEKYARYRFEDVFNTHSTTVGIQYPYARHPQFKLVGQLSTPIISWYTYKDPPAGINGSKSIQWAWQEPFYELKRYKNDFDFNECENSEGCCGVPFNDDNIQDNNQSTITTRHMFLDVNYPPYIYDYKLGENRLVVDEGDYTLHVIPPVFNQASSSGTVDKFFWVQLVDQYGGAGPYRAFDIDGQWDPADSKNVGPLGGSSNEYYDLYKTCTTCSSTTNCWVTDVDIFGPGYTDKSISKAEEEHRFIETYDGTSSTAKKTYYQRGLSVDIDKGNFNHIRTKEKVLTLGDNTELSFSMIPVRSSSNFEDIEPDHYYPFADQNIDVTFSGAGTYITAKVKLQITEEDVSTTGIFSRVECEYDFKKEGDDTSSSGTYYCIPAVSISLDGADKYTCVKPLIPTTNQESGSKKCSYRLNNSSIDLYNTKLDRSAMSEFPINMECVIIFKLPTIEDLKETLKKDITDASINITSNHIMLTIKSIGLFTEDFIEAVEPIKVKERKYYISCGKHGDFPPHGRNDTGSLLYPDFDDLSSIYQQDTINGVLGMPDSDGEAVTMNKVRGRILKECRPDKENITRGNIYTWEQEQKKIHDEIAFSGDTSFTLTSVEPPGLSQQLREIGANFPSWTCEFINTLVRPLIPIQRRNPYSPCGHLIIWDFRTLRRQICAPGRHFRDRFNYAYKHVCGIEYTSPEIDALTAYYGGLFYRAIIDPMSFVAPQLEQFEHVESNITNSVFAEEPSMTFPPSVS